jgi:4-carboxymuconolactone decarboxylase
MSRSQIINNFSTCLQTIEPDRYAVTRSLALYSAAITVADEAVQRDTIEFCKKRGADHRQIYEVMLQSYLFLGFPRMLEAASCLRQVIPDLMPVSEPVEIDNGTMASWLERGQQLCRQVYDDNYERLKGRVQSLAPEVFFWMELEGYGKVLSRPDMIDREMAIIACLMIENRATQLHSHLRGAINVGCSPELLNAVIADLAPLAEEGFASAQSILKRLGVA